MAEGRPDPARARGTESPATVAGFFVARMPAALRGRVQEAGRVLARPSVEPIAQRGYELERIGELTLPIAIALMEGGFIGVVADKVYQVHPAVLALISAAPMFGNLSSFVWARLALGRPKIPFLARLQALFVVCVAAIAFVPDGTLGAALLVASLVAARLVLGGIITLRSLVWTLNYPREARGRITARLGMLGAGTITVASLAGGRVLDASPEAFRTIYAVAALLSLVGVVAFSRIRLVGEREQLEGELAAPGESGTTLGEEGATALPRPSSLVGLLREDPLYARYLWWQFLLGVANMMVEAPLIYLVSRELQASYSASIAITLVIPFGLSMLTIPFWAAYLDRVHIAEFRAHHSWLFAISQFGLFAGALSGSLLVIGLSRVVVGVARGGGSLAWTLGHNDFADRDRAGLYMGVHVSLTGLRGAFAPFVGMLLYVGWSPLALGGFELGGFVGIGGWLMLGSCLLSVVASSGFVALHRRIARDASRRGWRNVEAAPDSEES